MHASSSSTSSGIQLSLFTLLATRLHLPTPFSIRTTSHNRAKIYDTAHDALALTTSNKFQSPSLVQVSQDACHRPRNLRSPRRRHRQTNHLIILQKTRRSGPNDHDSTTLHLQTLAKSHSRGYQKHRYHSTATSAVRGGTLRHFSHPMPPFRVTSTDRPGDFSTKSTSQASQKHTVPKATRKQLAFPTTASFSGHTALRDGKLAWD